MKKVYQIFATAAFTALATGAFAQLPASGDIRSQKAIPVKSTRVLTNNHSTDRVLAATAPANVLIDYVNGDIVNSPPTAKFYYWNPPMYMNSGYILRDTTHNVYTSNNANLYLATSCTVAFDTMWDLYTQALYGPKTKAANPTILDTIWAEMVYKNSSTQNDTVIFTVNSVSAAGFPAATVYGVDTVVITPTTMRYNSIDSVQLIQVKTNITIPSTGRRTWNFCINASVHGSKADTVGVWYWSQGGTCTPSGAVTSAYTNLGVPDGRATEVNSYITGLTWFNDTKNHGNGRPMTWPTYSGSYPGLCINNGGYYWWDQLYNGCTDSAYFPPQDIGIYASVSLTDVSGVQELADNGFSVNQNYPNPFNQNTVITYSLAKESNVVFTVYDMTGRELINNSYSTMAPGKHAIELVANQFTPGVYFYTFNVNGVKETKRMVITQ